MDKYRRRYGSPEMRQTRPSRAPDMMMVLIKSKIVNFLVKINVSNYNGQLRWLT